MTTPVPDPELTPTTVQVEDDPTKPWKALAAAVAAFVMVFIVLVVTDDKKLTGEDIAQYLGTAALLSGLPGLGSFVVPNPKRPKRHKPGKGKAKRPAVRHEPRHP